MQIEEGLYRLKQAPCAWYAQGLMGILGLGFTKSEADPNLYLHTCWGRSTHFRLYVDDLFLTRSKKLIRMCKEDLASEFEMKDIGLMHYFLGLEVWQ
jgi:hypothetical protein